MPATQTEFFREQAQDAWRRCQEALAAHDIDAAARWLDRARRFAPDDPAIALALAGVRLRQRRAAEVMALLMPVARRHESREVWLTLAMAASALHGMTDAAEALAEALSGYVWPTSASIGAVAGPVARVLGLPGWCALLGDGRVFIDAAGDVVVTADGEALPPPFAVPPHVNEVVVTSRGRTLLGSPLEVSRMRRVSGLVEMRDGILLGWAWLPRDPDRDPALTIDPVAGGKTVTVVASDRSMAAASPLTQPRRFQVPALRLRGMRGLLRVRGSDGRDVLGSPLGRSVSPMPAPRGFAPAPCEPERDVAVVVPVYGGAVLTRDCLAAVLATVPAGTAVIVVDDATPEPALATHLDALRDAGRIVLIRHAENRGFPASANAGMRMARAEGRDVVLLNSDTRVAAGWLQGLRAAVQGAPDVATATPLSNDGSILSYPDAGGGNPAVLGTALGRLARRAAAANGTKTVDIPTAVGFCMYVRRECLETVGLFREDAFAQGYGEENDFCRRAAQAGWRHVGVPGVYVAHVGGQSFGDGRAALLARNLAVLERLHPDYGALIDDFLRADPLAPARRRLDVAQFRAGRRPGAVALVTHDSGGGVERVVQTRIAAIRAAGERAIVLRPVRDRSGGRLYQPGLCWVSEGKGAPNLRFHLPAERAALLRLLRGEHVRRVEVHHSLGHDHSVMGLAAKLGVTMELYVHDYALICPRVTLVGREGRYCGEPDRTEVCDECVAAAGSHIEEVIGTAELRARSALDVAGAARVVVPSRDVARRLRRYFPALAAEVAPWEDDAAVPMVPKLRTDGKRLVAVIGGIGVSKGYDMLLGCARDAAARRLPLEFVVVGHTEDDGPLLATGRAFVTGAYREEEGEALVRAQGAQLAWLPSLWPETWSFTLGLAWRAGLGVAAFDLGAPAERIRGSGRGWLLPLGLPPEGINNALLALRTGAGDV